MEFPEKLVVRVGGKHIKNGKPGSPSMCAVSLAIREKLKANGNINFSVGTDNEYVSVSYRNENYSKDSAEYRCSTRCDRFISKFDTDKKSVKPKTFIFKRVC